MDRPKIIVLLQYDPTYALAVLAHGGVNTFPGCKGVCQNCGTELFYNSVLAGKMKCPKCGGDVVGSGGGQAFYDLARIEDGCDFIRRAAKRG